MYKVYHGGGPPRRVEEPHESHAPPRRPPPPPQPDGFADPIRQTVESLLGRITGELEDRISSVLSDPEQLARIREMAQSIMGGASESTAAAAEPAGPDPAVLGKLGALLRGGLGQKNPRLEALEALAPCLGEKRREKLTRAMKLARVLRLAQAGLLGPEDGDV